MGHATSESSTLAESDRWQRPEAFVVNPDVVGRRLAAIAVLLVIAGVVVQLVRWKGGVPGGHTLIWLFDLDTERNLPAFYSAALLALASGLLVVAAALERSGKQRPYWGVLAGGFVLMAYDEWTARHEQLIEPVREMLGKWDYAIFYFAWVVPAILLIVLVGVAFAGFLGRLPRATRVRFLAAGGLYLGGAVGMEMVGSYHYAAYGDNLTQAMIAVVEETMEMSGAIYFVYSILRHLADQHADFRLRFANAAKVVQGVEDRAPDASQVCDISRKAGARTLRNL